MSKRPDIDFNVLDALENAGVERVKLEMERITATNIFTFGDVEVVRGAALDWLSWKQTRRHQRAFDWQRPI